jgi:hypothetical protein
MSVLTLAPSSLNHSRWWSAHSRMTWSKSALVTKKLSSWCLPVNSKTKYVNKRLSATLRIEWSNLRRSWLSYRNMWIIKLMTMRTRSSCLIRLMWPRIHSSSSVQSRCRWRRGRLPVKLRGSRLSRRLLMLRVMKHWLNNRFLILMLAWSQRNLDLYHHSLKGNKRT